VLPVAESRTISGLVVRRILNIVRRHDEEVNIINENGILSEDKRSTAMTLVIILMIEVLLLHEAGFICRGCGLNASDWLTV